MIVWFSNSCVETKDLVLTTKTFEYEEPNMNRITEKATTKTIETTTQTFLEQVSITASAQNPLACEYNQANNITIAVPSELRGTSVCSTKSSLNIINANLLTLLATIIARSWYL
jgi:hypothetical protein